MSETPLPPQSSVEDRPIETELQESYLTYAMSTIMDRALPDVRDGLKPSQRRILVAMNDLGLGPRAKHRKCAKIAGDTSGNYHPHGEAGIYPTLVRLAQDWTMRCMLIDGQGNFGSCDGDPPADRRHGAPESVKIVRDKRQCLLDVHALRWAVPPIFAGKANRIPARPRAVQACP